LFFGQAQRAGELPAGQSAGLPHLGIGQKLRFEPSKFAFHVCIVFYINCLSSNMNKIQYESIVRNLVVAYKVARQKNKQPVVVLVYADSPDLPMAKKSDRIHGNNLPGR
jgi:hypothetical protein